jgi:hypothetical protein
MFVPPVNSLKHEIYVKNILKLNSHFTENTLQLHYKIHLVNFI